VRRELLIKTLQKDKVTFKLFHGAGSPVYADKETDVLKLINNYLDNLSTKYMKKNTKSHNPNHCDDSTYASFK
jgi:23S rRNA maturation mini-RNase III